MKNHRFFSLKRVFFVTIFNFVVFGAFGSYKHISFEVLNKDDGIDNNTIYAIMKDKNECMWFATDLGLSKYDGLFFHNFKLPQVTAPIIRLYEGGDGIILAQTTTGWVFAFDYIKERQIGIVCSDKNITDYPIRIAPAGGNSFFATSPVGLFKVDYVVDRDAGKLLWSVLPVADVKDNLLFAATDTKGRLFSYVQGTTKILCYDPSVGSVKYIDFGAHYRVGLDGTVDRMRAFDDLLWIGLKYDGVLCYDFASDKVVKLSDGNSKMPLFARNYNYVLGVDKYNDSTYFAATQRGSYRMNFNGQVIDNSFTLDKSPTSELSFRNIIESQSMCVFADLERNLVWVGTFGGGVIKYDLNNEFYKHIDMNGTSVNSMFEDRLGYLWLATSGGGILKSDTPNLSENTKFQLWGNPANNPQERYVAYRDNNSSLLIFGDSRGKVIEFDNLNGLSKEYQLHDFQRPNVRINVNGVFMDSKLRRWAATSVGLFYRAASDPYYKYVNIEIPPYGYGVSTVIEDNAGIIWIGTPDGVMRLNIDNSGLITIGKKDFEANLGIDHAQVYSMFINARGQIVIGYVDRIHRITPGADSVEHICSLYDNLPDGHITCMVDDKMGNTWFGSNAGIINIRSSGSHVFSYSAEGAIRSACRLSDGRLVWGGSNGLTFFYPAIAYNDPSLNRLILSALYVGRTEILPGVEYDNGAVLEQALAQTNRIELPFSKSSMTIFVTDCQYTITPKRLSYILEPGMSHWESTTERDGINFQWLPKGSYKLRVKSQFHDDSFGEESLFEIIIIAPWYDSWWMWLIYIVCGGGILLYCYLSISKHVAQIKDWYVSKVLEVADSRRVMEISDGKEDAAVADSKLVLIVSSDIRFVKDMESGLGDGYNFLKVSNTTDALFAALEDVPAIIVCDTKVQGESGFDFCRKVKDNLQTCHIPFLMFGDLPQSDSRMQAQSFECRVDAYLSKKDGVEVALVMLARLLDNRKAIRESVANYIGHHSDVGSSVTIGNEDQGGSGGRDDDFVRELVEVIENNVEESDFNVKRLAELMNMSQSTLYRRVMQSTQTSIVELVRDVRLNRAAKLLRENSKLSVQQVAELVGYNDMATFRKHFSAMFGVTPSRYLK